MSTRHQTNGDRVVTAAPLRLAELVAALSLGIDLGFGQPMEHILRQCVIALRLSESLGLDDQQRSHTYYTALLVNVGCHTDAHEQAKWFGDDIRLKSGKYDHELGGLRSAAATFRFLGSGNPPLQRARTIVDFALAGHRDLDHMIEGHAMLARGLARDLALPEGVQTAVGAAYEQWDGKGWPGELSGEDVPIASRVSQLSEFMEVAHRFGGVDAATDLARSRSGGQFDPDLVSLLCDHASLILDDVSGDPTWQSVIRSEPALTITLNDGEFDNALRAVANFVDLKSPYLLGHSNAVADLAGRAGRSLDMADPDVRTLERASLVIGFGRLGVSNSIWDKAGPVGPGEWERIRMQPYLTERMTKQSDALAPLGALAVQHRERLDGSGYPRGLVGGAISFPARVLAAADVYQAMLEPRPHRNAATPEDARATLQEEVRAGRLDGDAASAVLTAAGHRVGRRRQWPAGLTTREVEVLRLLARGMSAKEIAAELVISPKTARNHIEHIYVKIGATTRVAAGLFAVQQGLIPAVDGPEP
jgi:HD-GYP domain-containing protein (c-di-GMP phosphodiesterase class II)